MSTPAAPAVAEKPFDAVGNQSSTFSTLPVTVYGYDAIGDQSSVILPNGVESDYTYDGLNHLTQETVHKGQQTIATYSYTVRSDGIRTQALEHQLKDDNTSFSDTKITWSYDGLDRLTMESYDAGRLLPGAGGEAGNILNTHPRWTLLIM